MGKSVFKWLEFLRVQMFTPKVKGKPLLIRHTHLTTPDKQNDENTEYPTRLTTRHKKLRVKAMPVELNRFAVDKKDNKIRY